MQLCRTFCLYCSCLYHGEVVAIAFLLVQVYTGASKIVLNTYAFLQPEIANFVNYEIENEIAYSLELNVRKV